MPSTIRLALRDWDWVTPLLLGEVDLSGLDRAGVRLEVERVGSLPDLWTGSGHDLSEVSLSRYCAATVRGDERVQAVPHVLMHGFRHRCVLVAGGSAAASAEDLAGTSVGLTGWPDSGNTWTRAALAADGLAIDDVRWVVGRLTHDHPRTDRLGGYGRAGHLEQEPDRPLLDLLGEGEVSAVLTPFMPAQFYGTGATVRCLWEDVRAREAAWLEERGFVPGHHLLAFRAGLAPEIVGAVSGALEQSRALWTAKRRKYGETSAWLTEDLRRESHLLPEDWARPGLAHQGRMIEEFCRELRTQGLVTDSPALETLFPMEIAA